MDTQLAVIKTGGKQYLVKEGTVLRVEKLDAQEGAQVSFGEVLLVAQGEGGEVKVGTPYVANAAVEATVVKQGRARKVTIIKFKPKTRYYKKQGHRQQFTEIKITKIRG